MISLTSRQRKVLEQHAQPLSALAQIGGAGVTDAQIANIAQLLQAHELIKVKFNAFKDEKQELSRNIEAGTRSTLVRIIGNTAIFYRAADDPEKRAYEQELAKA